MTTPITVTPTTSVASVLQGVLDGLRPRTPRQVVSPDTLDYQYSEQKVDPDDHLLSISANADGRYKIIQGTKESTRTVLLLPYPVTYSDAEDVLAAMISARKDGHAMGWESGWNDGFDRGYNVGHKTGTKEGRDEALSEFDRGDSPTPRVKTPRKNTSRVTKAKGYKPVTNA